MRKYTILSRKKIESERVRLFFCWLLGKDAGVNQSGLRMREQTHFGAFLKLSCLNALWMVTGSNKEGLGQLTNAHRNSIKVINKIALYL